VCEFSRAANACSTKSESQALTGTEPKDCLKADEESQQLSVLVLAGARHLWTKKAGTIAGAGL